MEKRRIKCIFFDLGKVLLGFDLDPLARAFFKKGDVDKEEMDRFIMRSDLGMKYMCGKIDSSRFYNKVKRHLKLKMSYAEFYDVWNSIFYPYPEMEYLVGRLRERYPEIKLILVSDTNESHFEFIKEKYSFIKHIDECVLSYKIGAMKPDASMYTKALSFSEAMPREVLYFDDREKLVKKARTMGIVGQVHTSYNETRNKLADFGINV